MAPATTLAQATGTIRGLVTNARDAAPLRDVRVAVQGTPITTVTDPRGGYTLPRVPAGERIIVFYWLGFRPAEVAVTVARGGTHTVDAALEAQASLPGEVVVEAPSREPERVVDAPASTAVVEPQALRSISAAGQLPIALEALPGVDLIQNGVYDFNLGARGFNTYLNRRVQVLVDGRELAFGLRGIQQWNALSLPMEDMARVEMVRGPGAALYGGNAVSGVLDIRTPTAREVLGTRVTLAGGELSTFRGDVRHAGVFGGGRFGFRLNAGYSRSDSWDYSRTLTDGSSLGREYAGVTSEPVPPRSPIVESFPLNGQVIADSATGTVAGDLKPVTSVFGSVRFDYYADDKDAVGTVEGGVTRTQNVVFMNAIGRAQLREHWRPWVRAVWAHENFHVMAWWTRQAHPDSALVILGAGPRPATTMSIYHVEGQYNASILDDRARVVLGTSYRLRSFEPGYTEAEMRAAGLMEDELGEPYYAAYGQFDYGITPRLRAVVASRLDLSGFYPAQWSPRAALVYCPTDRHAVRFTVNRAFQAASLHQLFSVYSVAPHDLTWLEDSLRAGPWASALSGVPAGMLFSPNSGVWVMGNSLNVLPPTGGTYVVDELGVEKVTSYELGYRGQLGDRVLVTIDGYYSRLTDFVTDPLPGMNPDVPPWTAPATVPDSVRAAFEQEVARLQPGLARLNDGSSALVMASTNAGKVDAIGVELAARVAITPELRAGATYAYFDFDIKEELTPLQPNTPKHKAAVSISYTGTQGLDLSASALFVDSFRWLTGLWDGTVPSRQTVNLTAGYQVNNFVRLHAVATNMLNQRRFHAYGSSVIGRRILGGVTATF